jgi:hypothetical protein
MKLSEVYNKQQNNKPLNKGNVQSKPKETKNVNVVVHLPEVGGLIKHLEVLYSSMIVQNMNRSSGGSMWDRVSWFNPGQGAVKQSQSVN